MSITTSFKRTIKKILGVKGKSKGEHEMDFWEKQKAVTGELPPNDHFVHFYTEHFGLDKEFYTGKKILDIGCGPMGSLEWADQAAQRIGLDPLADSYKTLGTDKQKMTYTASGSENIPFPNGHFDVVCSFNSLDHVDDLDKTIAEIKRVLRPGGLFLLITDVNHDPTPAEPIVFSWDIVTRFDPEFKLIHRRDNERSNNGVYQSLYANIPYDHNNGKKRYGITSVKFIKQ
jgi:SAM-dependent methyltransferase